MRLVAWLSKAAGIEATAAAPRYERGGRFTVVVRAAGWTRRVVCTACAGDSVVTGKPCPACNRTGYVAAA